MKKFILYDLDSNKIFKVFKDNSEPFYFNSNNIKDISTFNQKEIEIFNNFSLDINILLSYNSGEDFLIQHIDDNLLKILGLNSTYDIKGSLISEVFPISKELGFLEIIQEVYRSNNSKKLQLLVYDNCHIRYAYDYEITKSNDFIYILSKNLTEDKMNEEKLLDDYLHGIMYMDDNFEIYYMNNVMRELFGYELNEINNIHFNNLILDFKSYIYSNESFYQSIKNLFNGNILFDDFQIILNGKNKNIFLNMYFSKLSSSDSLVQVIALDMTEHKLYEERLLKLEDNLNIIQNVSKTALSYLNVDSGIRTWTPEIYKIIEREALDSDKYNNILNDLIVGENFSEILSLFDDISPENNSFSFNSTIKTAKDNIKYLSSYISGVYDEDNNLKEIIGITQDLTDKEKYQRKINEKSKEALKLKEDMDVVQKITKLAIGNWNSSINTYTWTDEFYNILEIDSNQFSDDVDIISKFVIDEDKEKFLERRNIINPENPVWFETIRVLTPNNNLKYLSLYSIYNFKENDMSCIGFLQDISKESEYENKLKSALKDKELLLKEVHHRVKNNLQIILSLINLDKRFKSDNPMSIITEIQGRINAMALIHEKIYLSESLSHVNMCEYIDSIVNSLFGLYNVNIGFKKDLDNIALDMDHAIPLGLIINELLNNVIKYAFPNNENGTLYISLKNIDSKIVLKFQDDGVGLPEDLDIYNSPSLGLTVVVNLCSQIGASFSKFDCDGTGFLIAFKD